MVRLSILLVAQNAVKVLTLAGFLSLVPTGFLISSNGKLLVATNVVYAQQPAIETPSPVISNNIEEVYVEGQLPRIEDMQVFEITRYYDVNARGGQLYKMRRYDEAKPLLEVGAQMGFKMSQARLGAIYAYGLGSTPADPAKGLAWIGVAAEPKTDPAIRKEFNVLMKQIPKENRSQMEALISEQRDKYGSRATGTKCQMIRTAGSHMSWLNCEVKDLYRFRSAADRYDLCLMQGIEGIQSEGGGEMGIGAISVTPCI